MFIDFVKIRLKAGQGGSGCVSFHREKFVPKGGPDGGDGGRGGSIIFKASKDLHTLRDFTYRREYITKHGQHGLGSNCHGKNATDIILKVPVGTVIRDTESGEILVDFTKDNQTFVGARGGKGGKGNARFATATHQSPREWEIGWPGEERDVELELKSIADIGLVGFPNAGKSTLLSRLSKARPKIADYPFTTLEPNLGIVSYHDFQSFVMADIPGLIEGAHEGKGLGIQFLRHIERTRALVYLLDINEENPPEQFKILKKELRSYSNFLAQKPYLVVLNKIDLVDHSSKKMRFGKTQIIKISAATGQNLDELKEAMWQLIKEADKIEEEIG